MTRLVGPRNELIVEVDCPAESDPEHKRLIRGSLETACPSFVGGLWCDVALEVRSVAFLRDVVIRTRMDAGTGLITVTGTVVGEPAVPLSLDLSIEGVCVRREKLEASPAGSPFHFDWAVQSAKFWGPSNLDDTDGYRLQLELHGKSRTLDECEQYIGFHGLRFDPSAKSAVWHGSQLPVRTVDFFTALDPLETVQGDTEGAFATTLSTGHGVVLWNTVARVFATRLYRTADNQQFVLLQGFPLDGGYSTDPAFRSEAVRHPLTPLTPAARAGLLELARETQPLALRWGL